MRLAATRVEGAFIVEPDLLEDERGFFAYTWSKRDFAARGVTADFDQSNISYNKHAGTLRGLHYQLAPFAEAKLVRCTKGAIFDVAVDLRAASPTYKQWASVTLTPENRLALFIPEGCAHGFQSLTDGSEVLYLMSGKYEPSAARVVAWNDPALAIQWPPCANRILSARDAAAQPFDV